MLQVAPEPALERLFRSLPNLDYISGDLDSPWAMVKLDITNIGCEHGSFDVILCSHVLEHIVDDRKAMRELFRVLRPGGWAILQPPVDLNRETTFEDPRMVSPDQRTRAFGGEGHVRTYGRDYADRLEEAGFTVRVDSYARDLPDDAVTRYGLMRSEDIYFCTKERAHMQ
jgi:SAM-dependent methyltransferase